MIYSCTQFLKPWFLPSMACLLDPSHLRVSSEESAFHFTWVLLPHTISIINTITPAQATIFSPIFIFPRFPHTGITFLKCSSDYATLLRYPFLSHPPWPPSEIRIKSEHLLVKGCRGTSCPATLSPNHSLPHSFSFLFFSPWGLSSSAPGIGRCVLPNFNSAGSSCHSGFSSVITSQSLI